MQDFPFEAGPGQFQVRFTVEDGVLDYARGWPQLTQLDGEVIFDKGSLHVDGRSARTLDTRLSDVQVEIKHLRSRERQLLIKGHAEGPTRDNLRYLRETPLNERIGRYFEGATVDGHSKTDINMVLPLDGRPAKVEGQVEVRNGALEFPHWGVDVAAIDGRLAFSDQGITARGISAELMGQKASVDIATELRTSGKKITTFHAAGETTPRQLEKRFPLPVFNYMEGNAAWTGSLTLLPGEENAVGQAELAITSDLKGTAVMLPQPVGKTVEQTRNLALEMTFGGERATPATLRYGDVLQGVFDLGRVDGEVVLHSGDLHLGPGEATLPDVEGLRISGHLAELDEAQWRTSLAQGRRGEQAVGDRLRTVDLKVDSLYALDNHLSEARLQALRRDRAWQVILNSDKAQGEMLFPDSEASPVLMDFDFLHLVPEEGEDDDGKSDPRNLPPFRITSESFAYDDWQLGRLDMTAQKTPDGLDFTSLVMESEFTTIKGNGSWKVGENQEETSRLYLVLESRDVGNTLSMFGYAGTIGNGTGSNTINVNWRGAPGDFEFQKLNGTFDLDLQKGRVLDVEPGAGRIFGLLSVQALPRRLTLDFSDFFAKGFSFDKIQGNFVIRDGMAETNNLMMEGPAAKVDVKGEINLVERSYDQEVTVFPNVTGTLPLAIGVVASPVAGAAAWLAEKIFREPMGHITKVEYEVTGKWDNPVIRKIEPQFENDTNDP
jgi:uncharacterized protein (TIGR02099 family)